MRVLPDARKLRIPAERARSGASRRHLLDGADSAPRFPASHKSCCQQAQAEQSDKRQLGRGLGQVALIRRISATTRGSGGSTGLIIGCRRVLISGGRAGCAARG